MAQMMTDEKQYESDLIAMGAMPDEFGQYLGGTYGQLGVDDGFDGYLGDFPGEVDLRCPENYLDQLFPPFPGGSMPPIQPIQAAPPITPPPPFWGSPDPNSLPPQGAPGSTYVRETGHIVNVGEAPPMPTPGGNFAPANSNVAVIPWPHVATDFKMYRCKLSGKKYGGTDADQCWYARECILLAFRVANGWSDAPDLFSFQSAYYLFPSKLPKTTKMYVLSSPNGLFAVLCLRIDTRTTEFRLLSDREYAGLETALFPNSTSTMMMVAK